MSFCTKGTVSICCRRYRTGSSSSSSLRPLTIKANHLEKTIHPCQFPVELIERLVLALTDAGDWVLDPFMGVGTTAIAALMHERKAIGAELMPEYVAIAKERLEMAERGTLRIRPMTRSVYDPDMPGLSVPPQLVRLKATAFQPQLFEPKEPYTSTPALP